MTSPPPCSILYIKGLPVGYSEDSLCNLLPPNSLSAPIELVKGPSFWSAKITLRSMALAQQFLGNYNKTTLPGTKNKLTIQFYEAKKLGTSKNTGGSANTTRPSEINPVCVLMCGLPSGTTLLQLCAFVEQNICTRHECPQPVFIFPPKPGTPLCSAKVSFPDATTANQFARFANGRRFDANSRQALDVQITTFEKEDGKTFFAKPTIVKKQQTATTPAGKPSPSVFIKGLPEGTSANFLRIFVNIALSTAVNPNITVRAGKGASSECTAKIAFYNEQLATQFIREFNGGTVAGTENVISVDYFFKEKTSDTVHVKGLPAGITEDSLMTCIQQPVATKKDGKAKITLFALKDGYRAAKIVFINGKTAKEFMDSQDNRPLRGHKNKLTVKFWEDPKGSVEDTNKQADKVLTTVRNVVYVRDLPKTAYKKICMKELEYNDWKLKKIKLHTFADETLKGEGLFSFENHSSALKFIEKYNGKRFPKTGNVMKMSLFQSGEVRRLPNAIGTDHLFVPGAVAYAYDCVTCFDTWDERDMLGCVPIGHTTTDTETHFVCQTCAQRFASALTSGGAVGKYGTGLPCATGECGRVCLWAPVKRLLEEKVWRVLEDRMDNAALAGFKDIEFCKYCKNGVFIEQDKHRMQYFICRPGCGAQFCRRCKIDAAQHLGKTCAEADPQTAKDKARKEFEEACTQITVRICPKCNQPGVKDDQRCNHINCKNCGIDYCYMCRANLYGSSIYDHFQNGRCTASHQDAVASDNAKMEQLRRDFAGRL